MAKSNSSRYALIVILAGLLIGAILAGAFAFQGSLVLAQSAAGSGDEAEDGDLDDATEGADAPITGRPLEQAGAAALKHAGGGRVTGSEVGDEEGAYEIEVTFADGRQVDVHLDAAFNVLGVENE